MEQIIAITTDFGDHFASSQLRAVLAYLNFQGQVIENHDVSHFSISEGAFQILTLSRFTPKGTIHLGVIDPGVGSRRRGVIIQTKNFFFVGPDNGLLFPAAQKDGILKVYEINDKEVNDEATNTFHGRDIFIRVAAYLGNGQKPEDFKSKAIDWQSLVKLKFEDGQVLHVDDYGNLKINWNGKIKIGSVLNVLTKDKRHFAVPVVKTFSEVESGQPLALLGSSGTLELAVNLANAAKIFDIKLGDVLEIKENKEK